MKSLSTAPSTHTIPPLPSPALGHGPARILYVDDDPFLTLIGRRVLMQAGHEVDIAGDGAAAWQALKEDAYQLVITDNDMPGMSGTDLLLHARRAGMRLPILLTSGSHFHLPAQAHVGAGVTAFLPKPFDCGVLVATVGNLLRIANDGHQAVEPTAPTLARIAIVEPERCWGINE